MQILLRRDGIESLRYDGKMNRVERDETLSRFKKQGGPRILLIRYAMMTDLASSIR